MTITRYPYVQYARMKTGTYTGDGTTSQAITGVGFQPKVLWIFTHPTVHSGTEQFFIKLDQDWSTFCLYVSSAQQITLDGRINTLDSDGFTVDDAGVNGQPNTNAEVYDYVVWR